MGFGLRSATRFALAGGLALFLCWQHVQAVRIGYQVESARKTEEEQRGRVAALRLSLEQGLSPATVAERAGRLGLIPASPDALRRLPSRSSSAAVGLLGLRWPPHFPLLEAPRG